MRRKSKLQKKLSLLRLKFYLFIILPITIVALGKAVIMEYAKIKLRQIAAAHAPAESEPELEKRTGKK